MWALGGSVGGSISTDSSVDNGLELAANVEGYLTSRVSIRGQFGGSSWDFVGRGFSGSVKPIRLDGNVVYNWEGGAVHPYVTAGLGMYHYGSHIAPGGPDGGDTKAGFNIGGGVEYFIKRRTSLTAEALYHEVGAFDTPLAVIESGSFWTVTAGIKAYLGH